MAIDNGELLKQRIQDDFDVYGELVRDIIADPQEVVGYTDEDEATWFTNLDTSVNAVRSAIDDIDDNLRQHGASITLKGLRRKASTMHYAVRGVSGYIDAPYRLFAMNNCFTSAKGKLHILGAMGVDAGISNVASSGDNHGDVWMHHEDMGLLVHTGSTSDLSVDDPSMVFRDRIDGDTIQHFIAYQSDSDDSRTLQPLYSEPSLGMQAKPAFALYSAFDGYMAIEFMRYLSGYIANYEQHGHRKITPELLIAAAPYIPHSDATAEGAFVSRPVEDQFFANVSRFVAALTRGFLSGDEEQRDIASARMDAANFSLWPSLESSLQEIAESTK